MKRRMCGNPMFNQKRKQTEMKKFWNLMLAMLVILGAVSCSEDVDSVNVNPESEGLSFYAEFDNGDDTRVDVVYDEDSKLWNTVWTGDDAITVTNVNNTKSYTFTNTVDKPNKFTCTADGVESLVNTAVILSVQPANFSTLGKKGVVVNHRVENFNPQSEAIKLESQNSFLRYTYNGSGTVTLTLTDDLGQSSGFFFVNDTNTTTISFDENDGERWVSVSATEPVAATLSYSINGVKCKEAGITLQKGKIYNLGTLAFPYEVDTTWGIAGDFNGWAAGTPEPLYVVDEWLVAYGLTGLNGGFKFVQNKGWDDAQGGVPAEGTASATGEWLNCGINNISAADASAYDVYFVPERSLYCIVAAGGVAPELPEKPAAITWSLTGTYNDWGENEMKATEVENLFVAKGVELTSGAEIKVKDITTWDTSYGGGITNLNTNSWMKAYYNGSNVVVAASGTYDVYFEYAEGAEYSKLYLIEADGDYTAATEQTANGTLETPVDVNIGLVGSFQGWDVAGAIAMTATSDGWLIASNIELYKDAQFKFVKDNSWAVSYGYKDAVLVAEADKEYKLSVDGGQNIQVNTNGKFNIYFNASTLAFKYECVEEYTDLNVNITINNKAGWDPLYIYLEKDGVAITPEAGVLVEDNTYAISGDYIGSTLACKFISGSKVSEVQNITITKDGASVTLEETIIKLKVQLNTSNSKQWWGSTMKIHVWDTGTSFDTSWPGNEMTSEGNYTWSVIVPSELVGKTIKFLVHNGNGWQSSDSTVTIKAEGNTVTGSSIGIN